jgi:ABC-type transport system involved in multi-copper enzyme maturation permease subunit
MQRLRYLAWKEIYLTYTDRSTLLYMFATPLLISSLIGLVFGGLSGGELTFEDIPVAIVNEDDGSTSNGQEFNYGETLVGILMPAQAAEDQDDAITDQSCDLTIATNGDTSDDETDATGDTTNQQTSLDDLLNVTQLDDYEAARAGVQDGTYAAAIRIPSDFSASMTPQTDTSIDFTAAIQSALGVDGDADDDANTNVADRIAAAIKPTQVDIYGNNAQSISVSIVRGVTEGIVNRLLTGNAAITATIGTLTERASERPAFGITFVAANLTGSFDPDFTCAFQSSLNTISIKQQPINAGQQQSGFAQTLRFFGSAQAVFFALFTAYIGLNTIWEDRQNWTLQRLIMAPMPRSYILIGKILGNSLSVLLQIGFLLLALTGIASLVEGEFVWLWGGNPLLLVLLLLALTLSVSGVGVLIVGIARSREQTFIIAPLINVALGALGGAFGFGLPEAVAQFSPVYWGTQGFETLATGGTDIWLNLLVLVVQGLITFGIGATLFSRRVDI